MGIMLECDDCRHVQLVGMVPGGFSEIPNPRTICEKCGKVGSFHFLPGAQARIASQVRNMICAGCGLRPRNHENARPCRVAIDPEILADFKLLEQLSQATSEPQRR